MLALHIAAAILAAWRITELFTQDRITDKLRQRFPIYLWTCPRCMSMWAGGWAMAIFLLGQKWPLVSLLLNGPPALAWLYIVQADWSFARRVAQRGRELTIRVRPDGQMQYNSELSPQDSLGLMQMVAQQVTRQANQPPIHPAAAAVMNGEAKEAKQA